VAEKRRALGHRGNDSEVSRLAGSLPSTKTPAFVSSAVIYIVVVVSLDIVAVAPVAGAFYPSASV
jgi:hypothetical protein